MRKRLAAVAMVLSFGVAGLGQTLHTEAKLESPVAMQSALLCSQGSELVGVGKDGAVYLWKLGAAENGAAPRKLTVPDGPVKSLSCSGGTALVAGVGGDKYVSLDAESGEVKSRLEIKGVRDFAVSPDGELLAVGIDGAAPELWNLKTGQKVATGVTNFAGSFTVTFSPDGSKFLATDGDANSRAYDRSGKLLYTAEGEKLANFSAGFTADSKRFATCGAGGEIAFYDAETGRRLAATPRSVNVLNGLEISPDGKYLVAAEYDNFSFKPLGRMVWDREAGKARPLDVGGMHVIGRGRDDSHILLVSQDEGKAITVASLR
jgi:WD40 repeat protein